MQDHKTTLRKANEAISIGDYEGFLSYCTDDTHWVFMGDTELKGKQAVRQWMAENYIEPPRFDIDQLIAENEHLTAIGNIAMTDTNGTTTNYSYCDVWTFRDGKMAELRAFVVEKN